MKAKRFIIVLAHVDMEHGYVGDIIEGVGKRSSIVTSVTEARRYKSLKRALGVAERWTWYADVVRVMEVDE